MEKENGGLNLESEKMNIREVSLEEKVEKKSLKKIFLLLLVIVLLSLGVIISFFYYKSQKTNDNGILKNTQEKIKSVSKKS